MEAEAKLKAVRERQVYFEDLLQSIDALMSSGGATRSERADVAARLADAKAFALELQFQQRRAQTQMELDTGNSLPTCAIAGELELLQLAHANIFNDIDTASNDALAHSPTLNSLRRTADSRESVAPA